MEEVKAEPKWGFAEFFVISQTAFPAILFLPGTQALRLPLRVAAFAVSLAALAWWLGSRRRHAPHPATHWLLLAVVYLILMIFHPTTNTTFAGLAQTVLYLSVLAPVFWASSLIRSPQRLMRLLVILFICNGINSLVGVLQVYAPGYFMPQEFSSVVLASKYGLSTYTYVNSAGKLAIRPPGLFDTPGAVCAAGMLAALLGFIFSVNLKKLSHRLGSLFLGVAGVAAVYLSQVRTALLIMCGMMAVYVGVLWVIQKRRTKAIVFLSIAVMLVTILFSFTVARSGKASMRRFQDLAAGDPLTVYYDNKRGDQLENGFTDLLPSYPLGAGLGRWGMMRVYFGDETNVDSPSIWAELQFPAWILDGGVILMCLYCLALLATVTYELKISRDATNPTLRLIVPIIVAANIGVIVLIFGFTPFTTQVGMQYWFLAGALHGVARTSGIFSHERIRTGQRRFHHLGRHGSGQL
ncbi:MAG: hypothetical protein H7Y30_15295 [Pyrinomonadaceae bacterium]|nr:hypothetical protein [Pyrinomonadaceae bacterium]